MFFLEINSYFELFGSNAPKEIILREERFNHFELSGSKLFKRRRITL